MIVNLHTHTPRCHHAEGTEQEYAEAALVAGLKVLGFSDHTPYWFPGDYYSRMRMYPNELMDYADSIRALQKAYAGRLEIPLGVEVEYYPSLFSALLPRLRDAGIEYMLLGQHWNEDEIGQDYNGRPTESEEKLSRYCDQTIEAMQTGLFTYLAHPDLLHFVGERKIYEKHMLRICREAKACNLPLEINLLGINEGRHYANPVFWELAGGEGCTVVIGSDAHKPEHVTHPEPEKKALQLVEAFSLKLIESPGILRI